MARATKKATPKRRAKKPVQDWRVVFLEQLSKTGNVSDAAKKARHSRQDAYKERSPDGKDEAGQVEAKTFGVAWDAALEVAVEALELEARRRAAEGVLEPVFYKGGLVAKVKKYSDTLLIFLLKAHKPEKYRENIKQELHMIDDREIDDAIEHELARVAVVSKAKDAGTAEIEKPGG